MQPWRLALACVGLVAIGASSVRAQAISTDFVPTDHVQKLSEPLETLARDYRIEIYNAFRTNRAEYDRRRAALETLTTEWRAAGEPANQTSRFAAWLRTGRENSKPGSVQPLPPLPAFKTQTSAWKADASRSPLTRQAPPLREDTQVVPQAPALTPKTVAAEPLSQRPRDSRLRGFRAFARALSPGDRDDSHSKQPAAKVDLPQRATSAAPPAPFSYHAPPVPQDAAPAASTDPQARVADHNLTLARLENQLIERELWTAGMLSEQLATFEKLAAQHRELRLEQELWQDEQHQGVEPLRSHADAHELLLARIDQARRNVAEQDFLATDEERELELDVLAALADKLNGLIDEE